MVVRRFGKDKIISGIIIVDIVQMFLKLTNLSDVTSSQGFPKILQ